MENESLTMSRRNEFVRMLALDAIADDYEDLEIIYSHVTSHGARCGVTIQPAEIRRELLHLIELGWAEVWELSPWRPNKRIEDPKADQLDLEKYYYYVSETGRPVQLADWPDWPFDENGDLRADWTPPDDC